MIKIEPLSREGLFLNLLIKDGVVTLLGNMFHSESENFQHDMEDAQRVNTNWIVAQLNQIASGNLRSLHDKVGCLECELPALYAEGKFAIPVSIQEGGNEDKPRMVYKVICPAVLAIIRMTNAREITPQYAGNVIKEKAVCMNERVTNL